MEHSLTRLVGLLKAQSKLLNWHRVPLFVVVVRFGIVCHLLGVFVLLKALCNFSHLRTESFFSIFYKKTNMDSCYLSKHLYSVLFSVFRSYCLNYVFVNSVCPSVWEDFIGLKLGMTTFGSI